MEGNHIIDFILSDEEQERIPEPLRMQRDAQIDAIRNLQTRTPMLDGGESVDNLCGMIMHRVIMDAVTRNIILKKEGEVVKFPTD